MVVMDLWRHALTSPASFCNYISVLLTFAACHQRFCLHGTSRLVISLVGLCLGGQSPHTGSAARVMASRYGVTLFAGGLTLSGRFPRGIAAHRTQCGVRS